jgi:hypothetical protein
MKNTGYCLTIGKTYDVINANYDANYLIINDNGNEYWYNKKFFRLLSEIRIEIIDKLLE